MTICLLNCLVNPRLFPRESKIYNEVAIMATPPPLHGREISWPPPSHAYAAHEWIADVDNEIVVEVKGRPHLLTPLVKRYIDPYGLTKKLPPEPFENGGCPLCHSIIVSQLCCLF